MYRAIVLSSAAGLCIGLILGWYFFAYKSAENTNEPEATNNQLTEIRSSEYEFISPLLECELGSDSYFINGLNPLKLEIAEFIKKEELDAAVYFRDLNNGPWFGLNEHEVFSPASLLKLPVMMAYYKKSENDSDLLNKKVKYEGSEILLKQSVIPSSLIQIGQTYTIGELIERMIIYSDNAALTVLEQNIDQDQIDKVTLDLGVETATEQTPEDFMSVKGYAGLFRILYNASYVNKNLSEKALEILSRTEFKKGISAGVPEGIKVSHKFGERTLANGLTQFHDCGIVYHPNNPYLLCIMTRGSNLNNLTSAISKISSIAYDGVGRYTQERSKNP